MSVTRKFPSSAYAESLISVSSISFDVSIFSNLNQKDFESQNEKVCRKRVSLSGASFERKITG